MHHSLMWFAAFPERPVGIIPTLRKKVKERFLIQFHLQRGSFQLCIEEMYYFHKVVAFRKGLHQASKMSCMQLGKNEDWRNGEEM